MSACLTIPPSYCSDAPLFRARRQRLTASEIVEQICETATLPLDRSTTLPPEAYTSDSYFEWEVDNVLRKDWLAVAHVSQLPNPGDFIKLEMFGEPLLVVRGKD